MIDPILGTLAHLCVVVTMALVVVLACRFSLRRLAGASLAYASWSLVPISIAMFLFAKALANMQIAVSVPAAMLAPTIVASTTVSASTLGSNASATWLMVWLVGASVTALWIAMRQHQFVRGLGWLTLSQSTRAAVPILCAASTCAGPLVFGLLRPCIVVPSDFCKRYSEDEQRLVLAHELGHIRGGDLYANFASTLLQIVFWFNPLIHWASSRFRFDQELACDARVLRDLVDTDQTKTYVSAVLKTAFPAHAAPLACHWQSRHPLNERILTMTVPKPRKLFRRIAQLGSSALAAASCYGVLAFVAQVPESGEGQYRFELEYTEVDTTASTTSASQRTKRYSLALDADREKTINVGTNDACRFNFSIKSDTQDQITLPFSLNCKDEGHSISRLSTRLGARSTIRREIEHSNGKRVSHTLSFVVTAPTQ